MSEEKLVILCDGCLRPIEDGDGFLHVDHAEINRYRNQRPDEDQPAFTLSEFLARYDPAHWQAHHTECDKGSGSVDYDIAVEKVRTWPGLVATTAHMMGKTWLTATDWDHLLEEAASGSGRRITRPAKTGGR